MLKLYDYPRSSAAFRVRLALSYKHVDYTNIKVNLLNGEQQSEQYLSLNSSGLVPTLFDDEKVLQQSVAIVEYLDSHYPQPPLLPTGEMELAYVKNVALTIAADIHPLNNLRVLNYLRNELAQNEDTVGKWYRHWITLGLTNLEKVISTSKYYNKKFVFRDQFTLADICLLPQLINARRFDGDVSNYPSLLAIEAYCRQFDWVNTAYPPGV
jgi:maleylpyruvate isomerase